jgi:PEP-CTERM motif
MKNIIAILVIGLLSCLTSFSQGVVYFDINFGANAPPNVPGEPASGASLTGDTFDAILYLDTTAPVSGSIEELEDGTFTTLFQFTDLVYASYPGGGPALDYEGSWQLTDGQIQNLMAGQLYADVTYSEGSYVGQITAVPEPSSVALLLTGLVVASFYWHRRATRFGLELTLVRRSVEILEVNKTSP